MHSISMYTIRCTEKSKAKSFKILSDIGGDDIYDLLESYISSKTDALYLIEANKQVFGFFDVKYDVVKRHIYGWMRVGHYGVKSDIINIDTGKVDFTMSQKNAGLINHYFRFFVPKTFDEGIALFHSCRRSGIKSLFFSEFRDFVSGKNWFNIHMNPLSYDKAFDKWAEANTKEIRLISFNGMNDVAAQIKSLGHDEQDQDLVIRAKKKSNSLGLLRDYLTSGSEQSKLIEVFSQHCSHIKTVVQIGSKRKTFYLERLEGHPICEIDIDDELLADADGNYDLNSINTYAKGLIVELAESMYPNMGVET